jgi:hypothetical protein
MKFSSAKQLEAWPSKAVTIMGMSGVGKTTLANLLRDDNWFHYSVDYRIGTRYMGEHIVDNFKREAMKNPFLRELLKTDSIYIASNISFNNLDPLSTYLGKPGNPDKGGIPFAEYKRRQAQHRQAEIQSLLDVPLFMDKARSIYAYEHFICDAGGSLCEVVNLGDHGDPVLNVLSDNTLMLYIRGTEEHSAFLVERFRKAPKPMYYQPQFLEKTWADYKRLHGISDDNAVDPDEFIVWGFEKLLHHRIPLYEDIARRHGYAVEMADIPSIRDEKDFLALLARAISDKQQTTS